MTQVIFEVDSERLLPRVDWSALVRARAGFACERCGATDRRFHAHHRNGDAKDNRLANGECLCVPCHSSHHRELHSAFKDPEIQRELSRRSRAKTPSQVRNAKGWATWRARASDAEREERTRARVEAAAAQDAKKLRNRALAGWVTRYTQPQATHCRRGHEYSDENTIREPNGTRRCRTCRRASERRRKNANAR